MAKRLENKVAVITGATSGMALATAKLFVEEGAYVFITGRRQKELDEAVKAIGKNVTGIKADSSNVKDLDQLFETVKKEKGSIDILYASAGAGEFNNPIGTITEENFDNIFNTNVKGTLFTVQKALPLLKDGGAIVLTGTMASVKIIEGMSVYSASKAALNTLARTWSIELKKRQIRVNIVSPGPTRTAALENAPKETVDWLISTVPYGRLVEPGEIASSVLFLASDDSKFVTGMELFVDGGANMV